MSEHEIVVSESEPVPSRAMFFVFVTLISAGFIGLDILAPYVMIVDNSEGSLSLLPMFLVVGQLTLICVWGTLVEGTFWLRLPWTVLLLVVSWAALSFGNYLGHHSPHLRWASNDNIRYAEIISLGLVWLYGFAVSYVPLKIAAWAFGWRIRRGSKNRALSDSGRYAIRDMMLGTAFLAVTLAIGRQFMPSKLPEWSDVLAESPLSDPGFYMMVFVFSVISLIVKLPCIWIALATPKRKVVQQSLIWIFVSGMLGSIEMGVFCLLFGGPVSDVLGRWFALFSGHAAMALTMIAVLYVLRHFGYEMTRQKKKLAVPNLES